MAEDYTPLEKLLSCGKELGYSGEDLRIFVEKQQKAERDDRAERRSIEAEQAKLNTRLTEAEIEKLRLATEATARELELARFRSENSDQVSFGSGEVRSLNRSYVTRPKLPRFDENKDEIDVFIERFESFAEIEEWPQEDWSVNLSALLTGKALTIQSSLPKEHRRDYHRLKRALLKGYDLTEEGFRLKFRTAKIQHGETYLQFGNRLEQYFKKWVELSETDSEDVESLKDLILREQLLHGCSPEMKIHLRQQTDHSMSGFLGAAEVFRDARVDGRKVRQSPFEGPNQESEEHCQKPTEVQQVPRPVIREAREPKKCFLCNRAGHIARDCRVRPHTYKAAGIRAEAAPGDREAGRGLWIAHGKETVFSGMAMGEGDVDMPVREGMVNGVRVKVLRDTGCSGAVVRESLVKDHQRTGEVRRCAMIDGTVRLFEMARLGVDTPFFSGQLEALIMASPLYDLVIGNIEGLKQPRENEAEMSVAGGRDATPSAVKEVQDESLERDRKTEKFRERRSDTAIEVKAGVAYRGYANDRGGMNVNGRHKMCPDTMPTHDTERCRLQRRQQPRSWEDICMLYRGSETHETPRQKTDKAWNVKLTEYQGY